MGTSLLTRGVNDTIVVTPTDLKDLLDEERPLVFATLHDVTLSSAHNSIRFYT
jgi:hypothetical protein